MSEQAEVLKVSEAFIRARAKLEEEAKKPRPQAASYVDIKAFVDGARDKVLPATEYYKATASAPEKTLIVLNNYDKKLEFAASLLPQFMAEAAGDAQYSRAKAVLTNAQTSLAGFASSIETARASVAPVVLSVAIPIRKFA